MGSERVISLRLQLKGEDQVIASLGEVNATLEESGQILKDINEKSRALDTLTRKLKDMSAELESVSRRLATAQAGTGTGNVTQLEQQQKRLRNEINQTKESVADLRKQLAGVEQGSDAYTDIIRKIAAAKGEQKLLNDEIRKQQVAFERTKVAAGSYRDLELQLQQLRGEYRQLGEAQIKAGLGDNLLKQIGQLDKQLKSIDANMGIYTRNVGNYASAFDGLVGVTQRLAPIIGLTVGVTEFIQANSQASDAVADVAKTANASIPAIQRLQEELKFRNTRTSLVDQLQIAEIGGQLGVVEDDLKAFTEATDVVTVALKDEFGGSVEEVTKQVATLRNVIPGLKTEDVATDILQIGNALNFLSSSGNATAPSIADFVNRLSGVAGPLNVSKASIFGLSATLDELGVSAERGATAVQNTLFKIGEAPDKFAAIAGKGAAEFRQLVERDIVAAFGLVTKGAAESSEKNTEFIKLLGEFGIEGAREIETFGKLGENYDVLTQRIQQASAALEDTASVQQEFEKKNNNFAASVDKVKNAVINLTVNTDLQDFLSGAISGVASFINALALLPRILSENKTEFVALALAVAAFNREAILATAASIRQSAAYLLLTDATRRQALAQGILNTVTKAFPLLAIIAVVYAGVKAYQALTESTDAATRASERLSDAQKEIAEESAREASVLNKNIEILKSASSSTKERADAIKALQEAYPEYLRGMDLEKLSVSELTSLQKRLTDEIIRSVAERKKAAAQDEVATKIIEKQLRIQEIRTQGQDAIGFFEQIRLGSGGTDIEKNVQTVIGNLEKELKDLQKEFDETGKKFDEAFQLRRTGTEEIAASAVNEVLAEQAEKALKVQTDLRKLTIEQLKALDTDAAKSEIERREKADKRLKELAEQRAKDEKAAAENIYKLQQDLIKRTFEGRIQLAKNETANAISALVGTPQQIETQRALLQEKLKQTIAEIEKERSAAQTKALADIEAFRVAAEEARARNAADSSGRQLETIRNLNQIDETKAQGFFTLEQQRLDEQFRQGLISQEDYNERSQILELQHQRAILEIRNESAVAEKTLIVQQQQEKLAALAAGFQQELAQINEQEAARRALLEGQLETGAIDQPTFDTAVAENEAAARQARLDAEREFREEQAVIIQDASQQILDTEVDLAEQSLQLQQDTDAQKLESARRTAEQINALQNAQLDSVSEFIGGVSRLLQQDVENRRKYGVILKTLALAEIAINLRKELSAISLAAIQAGAATGPFGVFAAGGIYAAQAAAAIIRAAFNSAQVLLQKFEYGGVIPTEQSVAEVEGGRIPGESGEIKGRPHSKGGVKAVYNGRLVEFEGGEYHLRNGKETYIINKKSTQRFKETLLRISDGPKRFSRARKELASKINAYGGWGKKFATGGIAPSPLDVNPLAAPQVTTKSDMVLNAASREDLDAVLQVAQGALAMATATSTRIDNIRVINDPLETIERGTEQQEIKAVRTL